MTYLPGCKRCAFINQLRGGEPPHRRDDLNSQANLQTPTLIEYDHFRSPLIGLDLAMTHTLPSSEPNLSGLAQHLLPPIKIVKKRYIIFPAR